MQIVVTGVDCPVLPGVSVGVQRRTDVVQEFPADGSPLTWRLEADLISTGPIGTDLRGPFVHGRRGERFLYLCWLRAGEGRFRRAKLMLDVLPPDLLARAATAGLAARVGLAMPDGTPLCAAVRPPRVEWSSLDG